MPYLETRDRTTIFFNDWGAGPPVVLIHGWPLNADMWEYQSSYLARQGVRCIAYDRRGFGRSSQPWSGYDYDTFSDDLAALMEQLDLRDATLVGFSMGGGEVVRYLARHGSARVRKAVLVSAVPPFLLKTEDNTEGVEPAVFAEMVDKIMEDRPSFLAHFGKQFFGVGPLKHRVSSEMLEWTRNLALQASPQATRLCVAAFSTTDFRGDLPKVQVPTLVIHGDHDTTVPIDISGRVSARMIPGAELKVYEGAPHGLFITDKDKLNADLIEFIRR
ncbi:alpha/beta fold hydrolase [Chondromyces crocatus]|uniref:Arylesterase n=1 Tax=Chondromyces crocatus TaxID=52 RepID=A0A0K1EM89_CHOCO|nr:alpha/beta hydrolase [Chondromyces crocatus]AKT41733.1 arylesterase [Chondromyces crocatus]